MNNYIFIFGILVMWSFSIGSFILWYKERKRMSLDPVLCDELNPYSGIPFIMALISLLGTLGAIALYD